MRAIQLAIAIVAGAVSSQASAALYDVAISGSWTIETTTAVCSNPVDPTCRSFDAVTTISQSDFFKNLPYTNLKEGDNRISIGSPYGYSGMFDLTINLTNGIFTGRDLLYATSQCKSPFAGCVDVAAGASTFDVQVGVPEPATWALMLLGFGGIGLALRRKARSVTEVSLKTA